MMYVGRTSSPGCWMVDVGYLGKVCGEEILESWTVSWAAVIAGEPPLLEMNKEGAIT